MTKPGMRTLRVFSNMILLGLPHAVPPSPPDYVLDYFKGMIISGFPDALYAHRLRNPSNGVVMITKSRVRSTLVSAAGICNNVNNVGTVLSERIS